MLAKTAGLRACRNFHFRLHGGKIENLYARRNYIRGKTMRKKSKLTTLLWLFTATALLLCGCVDSQPTTDTVSVYAVTSSVTLKSSEVTSYDYTTLFEIVENGEKVAATVDMLDLSAVSADVASFGVVCSYGGKTAEAMVTVTAEAVTEDVWNVEFSDPNVTSVEIYASEAAYYNYGKYFKVTKNGVERGISSDMVENNVKTEQGTYSYMVTAGGVSKTLTVIVLAPYAVELLQDEVSIRSHSVDSFDFNALFNVTADGVKQEITADMVQSNVEAELGSYTYSVTFHDITKTLTVLVTDDYDISVIPSYNTLSACVSDVASLDVTMLFSVYVDGVAVEVTEDMIDASALDNAEAGQTYSVSCSYAQGSSKSSATVNIAVTEDEQINITAKNIVTYPNGEYIDLTTLFTITKGGSAVTVTNEMIDGTVDYSLEDEAQNITISYEGQTATATVTVLRGVVANYATGNVVNVKVGTDQAAYPFAEDFVVLVNGIRFRNLTSFLDTSSVDFSQTGTYTATLNVLYNNSSDFGLKPTMASTELTITYNVVGVDYTIGIAEDTVTLPVGTESYDVFGNISLKRNGINNTVGENKNWVSLMYTYGEVVSDPLDFSQTGTQHVEIDVYVYCTDAQSDLGEPIRVEFDVVISGNVQIEATDKTVFGNQTVYTTDLFRLWENGSEIEVTQDMISGKVDTFHAGTYKITAEYMGATATATVVVINPEIAGIYKTAQRTIAQEEESDDDDDGGGTSYWEDDSGTTSSETTYTSTSALGDLVISADGSMTINGSEATFIGSIDENTLRISVGMGAYEYILYYNNGIIVLEPVNAVHLAYHESNRPFIYFDQSVWTINDAVTINRGSQHILTLKYNGYYSYDVFQISSDETTLWYGLYTELELISSDYYYDLVWGEVVFADDFQPQADVVSSLTFNGTTEYFTMQSDSVGKVNSSDEEKIWAGMTFSGTVDGKSASLRFNEYEGLSYYVDGVQILSVSSYDMNNMVNGGVNHSADTAFVYYLKETNSEEICSYKFLIDAENKTFELLSRDGIFGQYFSDDDDMYLFLDGYGTGVANFDTSSYVKNQFRYTLINDEVKITFFNTSVTFAYGDYITLRLADLKNILTVKYCEDSSLNQAEFVNEQITDGAIVDFTKSVFSATSSLKNDIYESIVITTKDGTLTTDQKKATVDGTKTSCVDLSCVSQNANGFYQIAVTVSVDGSPKTAYFAVQVQRTKYQTQFAEIFGEADSHGTYSLGAVISETSAANITVDYYGNATVYVASKTYVGYCLTDVDNGKFTIYAFDDDNVSITGYGEKLQDGFYKVRLTGAASMVDYFVATSSEIYVSGTTSNILRKIIVDDSTIYVYSVAKGSLGEIVSVTEESDGSLKVIAQNKTFVAKAVWGTNVSYGLTIADSLRGTYLGDDDETLVLDGFGNATYGTTEGSYYASGENLTFTTDSEVLAFRLDKTEFTFQTLTVDIASKIVGKIYSAAYTFTEDDSTYSATATIVFKADGTAQITSVCSDYENGEYSPSFVGDGTYEITSSGKIIVKISSQTIAFNAPDVVKCLSIICTETSLQDGDCGYFGENTEFSAEQA